MRHHARNWPPPLWRANDGLAEVTTDAIAATVTGVALTQDSGSDRDAWICDKEIRRPLLSSLLDLIEQWAEREKLIGAIGMSASTEPQYIYFLSSLHLSRLISYHTQISLISIPLVRNIVLH